MPEKPSNMIRLPRRINAELTRYLRRGRPDLAEHYLKHKSVRRTLSQTRLDHARARTASGYFYKGQDAKALALAQASAERSRRRVPLADWTAGLAAWRSGDFPIAASHFEWLARSKAANSWTLAAGAYWAARAAVRTGRPEAVYPLLARAAAEPRTFYGLLAARQLALSPGAVTALGGLAMMSNLRYLSFKDFNLSSRVRFGNLLMIPLLLIVVSLNPPVVLFSMYFTYVTAGPVIWLWRKIRRHRKSPGA